MTDDRLSGLALIAGSAGIIVTLGLHPTGRELFVPGQIDSAAHKLIAVHTLALATLPVWFLGACGLSRRLGAFVGAGSAGSASADSDSPDRYGFVALVLYGFAMAAMLTGVALDGLVTPNIARQIVDATGTAGQGWRIAFNYNGMLDQAFVHVFVVASSLALVLWSVAILRNGALAKALAIYGCILGGVTVIALLSGQLDRYAHLFGMVIVGQAVWFIIAGAQLWRVRKA